MTRRELIKEAKALLAEAYEAVAEMIVLYLDKHPKEQLQLLCKEIDPENWNGLRRKVYRAQERLQASTEAENAARARETARVRVSHAKSVLRQADDDTLDLIVEALPPAQIKRLAERATEALPAFRGGRDAPLDIGHLPKTGEAKLNRWLQEGKDLWEKHGEELTDAQYNRFVDKLAGFAASVASEDLVTT